MHLGVKTTKERRCHMWHRMLKVVAGLALVATSGCSTVSLAPSATTASSHITCERTEQVGCLELDVLNVEWNAQHSLMQGRDRPFASQEERYKVVTTLGPDLYKAYKAGAVKASKDRTFTIYMWNVGKVPTSHMASYRLDGQTLTKVGVAEVTGKQGPVFDPITDLGAPDRVFQVEAKGQKPIGAALQIPWSMVTSRTYILICAGDNLGVYPNRISANEGHWLTPEYLASARKLGWEYMVIPFLSK